MHRYLAGGWSIRGRLLLATLPYLLLAGAFVAFLKVRCLGRCHFSADQEPLLPTRLSLCLSLAVVFWLTSAIRAAQVNGGVVIGDRTAHAPVLHFPQLMYFAVFTFGLLAPYQLVCGGLRGATALW